MKVLTHVLTMGMLCLSLFSYGQDISFDIIPESTPGSQDASITLTFVQDLGPYEFLWTGPSISGANENNQDQINLKPGEYCVSVTNSNCCIAESCVVIKFMM